MPSLGSSSRRQAWKPDGKAALHSVSVINGEQNGSEERSSWRVPYRNVSCRVLVAVTLVPLL